MPLSKNFIEKELAEKVVVHFEPPSIEQSVRSSGLGFLERERKPGEFRVDKVVAEYVGLDQIERESQQKEIADLALQMSREIQEQAYAEAYQLGREEGRQSAFDEEKIRIQDRLNRMESLITAMKEMRLRLFKKSEAEIVDLCLHIARRVLMREIKEDPNYIKFLVGKVLEGFQSDEKMVIKLSDDDFQWFEANRTIFFKDLELDEATRFEVEPNLISGGVIIETEMGVVDASLEQRLAKVETILKGHE